MAKQVQSSAALHGHFFELLSNGKRDSGPEPCCRFCSHHGPPSDLEFTLLQFNFALGLFDFRPMKTIKASLNYYEDARMLLSRH